MKAVDKLKEKFRERTMKILWKGQRGVLDDTWET